MIPRPISSHSASKRSNIAIVRLSRRAVKDLQGLEQSILRQVLPMLPALNEIRSSKLAGFDLHRFRVGDLRVIWRFEGTSRVVLRILRRNEQTYRRDRLAQLAWCELEDRLMGFEEEQEVVEELERLAGTTYYFPGELLQAFSDARSVHNHVYYKYHLYPHLDSRQRSTLAALYARCFQGELFSGVQGSPGTGKTLCALDLAEHLLREPAHHVHLILPMNLLAELREADRVKTLLASSEGRMRINTWDDWVQWVAPDLAERLVPRAIELEAMRRLLSGRRGYSNPERDLVLFQAFIQSGRRITRDITFLDNEARVEELQGCLTLARFKEKVCALLPDKKSNRQTNSGPLTRVELAQSLSRHSPIAPLPGPLCVIVDEAQDLLLDEHEALQRVLERWRQRCGHTTSRILLGDLYQRLAPTGYSWGNLGLDAEGIQTLDRNYRSTRSIVAFCNGILEQLRLLARSEKVRHLPDVPKPEEVAEVGEAVRLLIYPSRDEAFQFLNRVSTRGLVEEGESLQATKSRQAKILWPAATDADERQLPGATVYTARRAKGLEFESCIAFGLFEAVAGSASQGLFERYTLLTRARSRLLVVLSKQELLTVTPKTLLAGCLRVPCDEEEEQLEWILEQSSGVDVAEMNPDLLREELLRRCEQGQPYLDTYALLERATIPIAAWEKEALSILRACPTKSLLDQEVSRQVYDPRLRCLLRRAAGFSWHAADAANEVRATFPAEARRMLLAIAQDLRRQGLVVEANRLLWYHDEGRAPDEIDCGDRNETPLPLFDLLLMQIKNCLVEQGGRLASLEESVPTSDPQESAS